MASEEHKTVTPAPPGVELGSVDADATHDFAPPDLFATQAGGNDSSQADDDPYRTTVGGDNGDAVLMPVGQTFGKYRLLKFIKQGGFGSIDKAEDIGLRRIVALKRITRGNRFALSDEARAIAEVEHPNVVRIYDLGEVGDVPYFAMEFMDGGSLQDLLRDNLPDWRTAAKLVEGIALGVQCMHDRSIVHRDLKPDNVLLDRDHRTPKVADFGLARNVANPSEEVQGTPQFMPPEQYEGATSFRADVWGIGATLYSLLTGRPPFQGNTVAEIRRLVIETEPVAPRAVNPAVPADLETICLKCLRKAPGERYDTARDVATDLQHLLAGRPIAARPTPAWERAWKWLRREPLQASLLAVGLLALVAFGVGGFALAGYKTVRADSIAKQLQHEIEDRERLEKQRQQIAEARLRAERYLAEADKLFRERKIDEASRKIAAARQLADDLHQEDLALRVEDEGKPILAAQRDSSTRSQLNQHATKFAEHYGAMRFLEMPLALPGSDLKANRDEARLALKAALQELTEAAGVSTSTGSPCLLHEHPLLDATSRNRLSAPVLECLQRGRQAELLAEPLATLFAPGEQSDAQTSFAAAVDLLENQGDAQAALTRFQAILDETPQNYWCRFCLGLCCLRLNRPWEAEAHWNGCESQNPDYHWLYLLRGLARVKQGRYPQATADFAKVQAPPDSYERYVLLANEGFALLSEGANEALADRAAQLFEAARTKLREAIAIQRPGDAEDDSLAYGNLALVSLLQAERLPNSDLAELYREAKESLDRAISASGDDAELRRTRTTVYFLQFDFRSSSGALRTARSELEKSAERQSLSEALVDLQAVVKSARDATADDYFRIALLHVTRSDPARSDAESAIVALNAAIGLDPTNGEARLLRGELLVEQATLRRLSARPDSDAKLGDQEVHDLRLAREDASHVIFARPAARSIATSATAPPLATHIARKMRAYHVRAEAAQGMGELRSAFDDYGELLKLIANHAAQADPQLHREALMQHGWLALTPAIEQWVAAEQGFTQAEALLREEAASADPAEATGHLLQELLASAGRACATLRLQDGTDVDRAVAIMDQAAKRLPLPQASEPPQNIETRRRFLHAQADLYSQASVRPGAAQQRSELRSRSIAALRQVFLSPSAQQNTTAAQRWKYWTAYIANDIDLEPLRDTFEYTKLGERLSNDRHAAADDAKSR